MANTTATATTSTLPTRHKRRSSPFLSTSESELDRIVEQQREQVEQHLVRDWEKQRKIEKTRRDTERFLHNDHTEGFLKRTMSSTTELNKRIRLPFRRATSDPCEPTSLHESSRINKASMKPRRLTSSPSVLGTFRPSLPTIEE